MTVPDPVATIADVVAPMPEADFLALLAARQLAHRAGPDAARYDPLLTWDGFFGILRAGAWPPERVRVTRGGKRINDVLFRKEGSIDVALIEKLMTAGASVVAPRAHLHLPTVAALCDAAAATTGDQVECVAVATSGPGGALRLHYDPIDVLALQIDGAKRWLVFEDPVLDPMIGMKDVDPDPAAQPILDVVLNPGDWLFVPAGYRHRCENQGSRSLHLAVGFSPLTAPRALELIMGEMIETDEDRKPIRAAAEDWAGAEAALKQKLMARIAGLSLSDLMQRNRDMPVRKR